MIQRNLGMTIAAAVMCVTGTAWAEQAVAVDVARQGEALHHVVISPEASQTSRTAAEELADYLSRISGSAFTIEEGDGTTGLAVGAFDEFSGLELDVGFDPSDPFNREQYLLRSHADGIHLIGATDGAARLAVWDLLRRLGHRQFFPTDHWEVVPSKPTITIAVDELAKPSYYARKIYAGGSRWSYAQPLWKQWRIRNRNESSATFQLFSGHVYGHIINRHRDVFDANPEFYALVDGERRYLGGVTKFCIGNEDLRKLVVDDAVRRVKSDPTLDSVSMDPSDGGNWCECPLCAEVGSVSDRVVTLANDVAEAINNLGLGRKYVGIYAYNQHSPPPNIEVDPRVIVSVSTAFQRGGYSTEELIEQWGAKGAIIGLREYYAISAWHGDRPNSAKASNIPALSNSVRKYYDDGARFDNANGSHSWGAYGLGFYLLAQMLWDVENTDRTEELYDDFLDRGFGAVREPIGKFYRLINKFDSEERKLPLSEHLVGMMYRHLGEAKQLADPSDADLQARIDDLILYTRYAELYHRTSAASGDEAQALGEELLRHIHAIRRSMLVVSYRGDPRRLPDFNKPEGDALDTVLSIDEYTSQQIEQMLTEGVATNKLLDFEPISFSDDLVPAAEALDFPNLPEGSFGSAPRWRQTFYTWVDEPGEITLNVRGGQIKHYRNRGNVKISLHSPMDAVGEGVDFDDSVPPDGEVHTVTLHTPYTGLHWIAGDDGGDSTSIRFADSTRPYTVSVEFGEPFTYRGRPDLYFYVPRGTEVIGGFAAGNRGGLLDGDGKVVFRFNETEGPGYFSVDVPEGQDGRLWRIAGANGPRRLLTVPPYVAASPQQLLLPREVVERDRR